MEPKVKLWEVLFWPPMDNIRYRNNARLLGVLAALYYAVMCGVIIPFGLIIFLFDHDTANLFKVINALPYTVLGLVIARGIHRDNKIAVISGLLLSIVGLVDNMLEQDGSMQDILVFSWFIFAFIHSFRAIHAKTETCNA